MVVPGQSGVRQELCNRNIRIEQAIGFMQFMQPGSRSAACWRKCLSSEERERILRIRLKRHQAHANTNRHSRFFMACNVRPHGRFD
jgi:hypothetical protein